MRIAFLCSEFPPGKHGGIGTFTEMMARELVRRGHSVRVAGIYEAGTLRVPEVQDGVEVWRIPEGRRKPSWLWSRLELYRMVAQWAERNEIDLVEAPDYEGLVAFWPTLPVPVIVRLHGSATYFCHETGVPAPRKARLLERHGLRRADFCCSTSKYTARRTVESVCRELKVEEILYNGVEPSDASVMTRSRVQMIFTGTLIPKKGIFELASAWPLVQRQVPEAELHIFGRDGRAPDGRVSSVWLAEHLGSLWGRTVIYHGFAERATILEALGRARGAIFPSLSEAFALAPMEAMSRGCPTIYSSLSSGPELITNEQNGLLADPRSCTEMAEAIIRVLTDDELTNRIAAEGKRHVTANFNAGYWAGRNEHFYSRCISRA
jgi:glycosyltransferase involved in cell wall biosynthesis